MGFAYAANDALETRIPYGQPPCWPDGWTAPGGPNPWPPGWPPTNSGQPDQWPDYWDWGCVSCDEVAPYSIHILMPSQSEYQSDGQDFTVGVIILSHGASCAGATYSGSETITLSQAGGDGSVTFGNGTTITRTSDYGGFLDQVSYTIAGAGDTESFALQASVTISGSTYSTARNFYAAKAYIDVSVDESTLHGAAGDDTTPANTEDFTLTLAIKDSSDNPVTGYTGTVELKWTVDPQGSTPTGPTLYIYGVDGNASYSAGTATAVAAAQTANAYEIPSALWASGTDGTVTVKCRYSSYFTVGTETDTVVFRAEVVA